MVFHWNGTHKQSVFVHHDNVRFFYVCRCSHAFILSFDFFSMVFILFRNSCCCCCHYFFHVYHYYTRMISKLNEVCARFSSVAAAAVFVCGIKLNCWQILTSSTTYLFRNSRWLGFYLQIYGGYGFDCFEYNLHFLEQQQTQTHIQGKFTRTLNLPSICLSVYLSYTHTHPLNRSLFLSLSLFCTTNNFMSQLNIKISIFIV